MPSDARDRDAAPLPSGYRLRHPGPDDLDEVARLFAVCDLQRSGRLVVRRGDLRVRWLQLDALTDALLVEQVGQRPALVAYADLQVDRDPAERAVSVYVDGRVHPDHTGRGLARTLLDRAVARTAEESRGWATSATLRASVGDGDDPARTFFTAHGFVPVRHLLQLHLDLHAAPPAPVWPPGVRCRTFRPSEDEGLVWSVHQEAFADVATHLPLSREAWRESRIEREPRFDPSLVFLAEADGEAIGIAVCRAGSDAAPEDGLVRDLGVVPGWRHRGVGMALLRAAFGAFRERGLTGAALEVDDVTLEGAVELYRRAGMRVVRRTDILERSVAV